MKGQTRKHIEELRAQRKLEQEQMREYRLRSLSDDELEKRIARQTRKAKARYLKALNRLIRSHGPEIGRKLFDAKYPHAGIRWPFSAAKSGKGSVDASPMQVFQAG